MCKTDRRSLFASQCFDDDAPHDDNGREKNRAIRAASAKCRHKQYFLMARTGDATGRSLEQFIKSAMKLTSSFVHIKGTKNIDE